MNVRKNMTAERKVHLKANEIHSLNTESCSAPFQVTNGFYFTVAFQTSAFTVCSLSSILRFAVVFLGLSGPR